MEQWELDLIASIATSLLHYTHCPRCSKTIASELAADAISVLSELFIPRPGRPSPTSETPEPPHV